jgi:hypothetical protein
MIEEIKSFYFKYVMFRYFFIFIFASLIYSSIAQPFSKSQDTSYIMIREQWYHKDSINFLYDPWDIGTKQIYVRNFAFLVDDSSYHTYLLTNIWKIKGGYFFTLHTKLYDTLVQVNVISIKQKGDVFLDRKVKVGQQLSLKLIRYFDRPLIRSIEYPPTYNVMMGIRSVGILSNRGITYLFVSKNLRGLSYLDSIHLTNEENIIIREQDSLNAFLLQVVQRISYKEISASLILDMDTTSVKKSIRSYRSSAQLPKGLGLADYMNIVSPIKKMNSYRWKYYKIKTSSIQLWFWGIINEFYALPKDYTDTNKSFPINNFEIKIVHLYKDVFTIRVRWSLPFENEKSYCAFFSIKKQDDKFKIIGFNIYN